MKDKYMVDYIMMKDNFGDWCMFFEFFELIYFKDFLCIMEVVVLGIIFYYYLFNLMVWFVVLVGYLQDVEDFWKESELVKEVFNLKYFYMELGYYSNNIVIVNIFFLWFGMVFEVYKEVVFWNIVEKIMKDFNGYVSIGLVGIQQLMCGLLDYGRIDFVYWIVINWIYLSWGYMVDNGVIIIWELWNGNIVDLVMNFVNYVMLLGDLIVWVYGYLGGISNVFGSVGFKQIQLKFYLVDGFDFVNILFYFIYGEVRSYWKKEDGLFCWDILVLCNIFVLVYVLVVDKSIDLKEKKWIVGEGGIFFWMEGSYVVFSFFLGSY